MTITPFLALRLRSKKDAIFARQRARRVACLLQFEPHEQICVAAGVFVIACQALAQYGAARLCFQIENRQLQVFAERADGQLPDAPEGGRLAGFMPAVESTTLFRLAKTLPESENATEEPDLGWLVRNIEATAHGTAFDEIVRQNQETLALLHELRLYRANVMENPKKTANPHAA